MELQGEMYDYILLKGLVHENIFQTDADKVYAMIILF